MGRNTTPQEQALPLNCLFFFFSLPLSVIVFFLSRFGVWYLNSNFYPFCFFLLQRKTRLSVETLFFLFGNDGRRLLFRVVDTESSFVIYLRAPDVRSSETNPILKVGEVAIKWKKFGILTVIILKGSAIFNWYIYYFFRFSKN